MHLSYGKCTAFSVALLFLLSGGRGFSQVPYYLHYGTQEGLLNVEVYNLLQDSAGFVWIASDHGVSKFDGRNFTHFSIKDGLPHNLVTELFLDLEGRVWCQVHRSGLVCIERDSIVVPRWSERLTSYSKDIGSFGQMSDGRYIIGFQPFMSDSTMLFAMVAGPNDSISWVRAEEDNTVAVLPDHRTSVYANQYRHPDKPYRFFWGIPGTDNCTAPVTLETDQPFQNIICSKKDSFAFLASGNKLFSVSPGQQYSTDVRHRITNSLFIDRQQNLWLGLFKHGALCFRGGALQTTPRRYLEDYSVTSVMQDRWGGYWFSTIEAGIFYMPFLDLQVYTTANGLPENRIVKAWRSDSTLWLIYRNGYATRTDLRREGPLVFEPVVRSDYIGPSFIDSTGMLNVSVSMLAWRETPVKVWPYRSILFFDSKGAMYLGDASAGLERISADGRVWASDVQCPHMPRINHIIEAEDGAVWLGSINGPYRMDGEECTFMPDIYPALAGSVTSLQIHHGLVFIGVGGKGLFVLNGDSLIHLYSGNGLSSDFIHRVLVDDRDTVWLATTSGIDLFRLDGLGRFPVPIEHLGAGSGLPSVCVNDLLIDSENAWAFTDGGLAVIPRNIISRREDPPRVYLTSVKVNGMPRDLSSHLELLHDENNLQVEFQAISFRGLSGTLYAYRLNGTGNIWNYTRVPSVNLSGLKPGDYILEIKHGHALDDASINPLVLQFSILPPLWQRWYFLLPATLLFFSGLYLLVYWRIRNLQWAAHLEQQVSTLGFRALQAQMNPHFIYNSLNAIQNFILKNDQETSVAYLNKFSRLIRSVFDHSARDLVPLSEELINIELYVSLEQARYPGRITFSLHADDSVRSLRVPPMLLQPFIENAILHGVLPSGREGRVSLIITSEAQQLAVRIIDNGIGIRQNRLIRKKKDRFFNSYAKRTHTGMQVTCQRIESFMHKHGMEANIHIEDRSTTSPVETGTIVFFTLPILKSP